MNTPLALNTEDPVRSGCIAITARQYSAIYVYCETGTYAATAVRLGVTRTQVSRLLGALYERLGLVDVDGRPHGQAQAMRAAFLLWGPGRVEWQVAPSRIKLDHDIARRIRHALAQGVTPSLAGRAFGVSERTIRQIRDNVMWKDPSAAPGRPVAGETA